MEMEIQTKQLSGDAHAVDTGKLPICLNVRAGKSIGQEKENHP